MTTWGEKYYWGLPKNPVLKLPGGWGAESPNYSAEPGLEATIVTLAALWGRSLSRARSEFDDVGEIPCRVRAVCAHVMHMR